MCRKSILVSEFQRSNITSRACDSQNSRFSHATYQLYYVLHLYSELIVSVTVQVKVLKKKVHCLGTRLWRWPACQCVSTGYICVFLCIHTRACRLEHSASAGIVRWHHVCLSERRGEGRRGSWFAWGRERLDCVYSLPAPKAESSRDTAGRSRATERQRQEGRRAGGGGGRARKREQERAGARKRRKASGSTTTGNLTPVTTLAMVNITLIHLQEKSLEATCTHTRTHLYSFTNTDTHHTNHCYTKQGQGWTIYIWI